MQQLHQLQYVMATSAVTRLARAYSVDGTTSTDHLTIGERFAHFLSSKRLAHLLSYIERVLGGSLAMTAFVLFIIEYLSHVRPLGALSPPRHVMPGLPAVRPPRLAIVTLKAPYHSAHYRH
jgi:hypothetical protein